MNALAFSYHKTEQKNSIKAFVVSISTVLLLLLLIFFFKFDIKIPDDPDAPPYLSLVDFIPEEKVREYENAGGSKGAEGFEDLEGGSQGNQEQTPQPQPDPIAEDKVVEETPVEKIPPPSAPKPVVTTSEPDVVKLPTPPPINIPAKPSTEVVTAPKTEVPSAPSKPTTTTSSTSSGDDDAPGSGGTGTGAGSGTGAGDSNNGSGSGSGGGAGTGGGGGTGGGTGAGTGSGTGDGVGVDFESTGPLKRARVSKPNMSVLASEKVQHVAFDICISREGDITYRKFNFKQSSTKDIPFVRKALALVAEWKFAANPSAPKKECGIVKISIAGRVNTLK